MAGSNNAGRAFLLGISLFAWGCGGTVDATCGLDNPCPAGSYCDGEACRSDCDPHAADPGCADGICTRDGRCARDQPDPEAGVCAAMVLEAEFGIPTVVLLVDQSGSMTTRYSGRRSRWDVLRDALIDPTSGVVTEWQDTYRFGLTLYTNDTSTAACPDLTTVPPALTNRDAIAEVYNNARPRAETPTGESIQAVTQELLAFDEPGPKYIIVATDGEPDTCAQPNPQNGQPEAVAAAQEAYNAGITLYFLSVGAGTVSEAHMQDMANAGVGNPIGGSQNAPFYEAGDATELAAAFDAITAQLLTCDLNVNGEIAPEAVSTGVIYLDGNRLVLDDPDGWTWVDQNSFRLQGAACTEAQRAGDHTVTAEFGCEATTVPAGLTAEGGGAVSGGCATLHASWLALAMLSLLASRRLRERKICQRS